MRKPVKNYSQGNKSTPTVTPTERNTVSCLSHTRLKKQADKLNAFIESNGFKRLYDEFKKRPYRQRANLYLFALNKAYHEFLSEESKGNTFTRERFVAKAEAAALLFPEDKKKLNPSKTKKS